MSTVTKVMVSCILAILLVVISSGGYSMIQGQLQPPPTLYLKCTKAPDKAMDCESIEASIQISNIPEIRECQMLHASWNPVRSDTVQSNNSTAHTLFIEKSCRYHLERNPETGQNECATTPEKICVGGTDLTK